MKIIHYLEWKSNPSGIIVLFNAERYMKIVVTLRHDSPLNVYLLLLLTTFFSFLKRNYHLTTN